MKNARKSRWALLYKFHRYTGLVIAVILLMLAITGIGLNHTDDLKLDQRFVDSTLILDWYGISLTIPKHGYPLQAHWISQVDRQIYLDSTPLLTSADPLLGVAVNESFAVIALSNNLIMLTKQGEIIEQIEKTSLQKIAAGKDERIYIKRDAQVFYSEDALLSWQSTNSENINWSQSLPLPPKLIKQLQQSSRKHILPYERLLLDMHSGRFFGRYGVFLVDFSGILLILLTISGCWIWLRHKLKPRYRRMSR